jgi:hypothetical protein
MRLLKLSLALVTLPALAVPGIIDIARAADSACDRACLSGFVDQDLAALVARDPWRLPLTKTARYTENGQTLKLGDGMWGPLITMGTYKLYFADPKAGQAGFFGTLEEHGHPVIPGLHLKIENRKIAEMETIIIRSTARGSLSSPQDLKDQTAAERDDSRG